MNPTPFSEFQTINETIYRILARIALAEDEGEVSKEEPKLLEELLSLETGLKTILSDTKNLRTVAPVMFMRLWSVASIRRSLKKIRSAKKHSAAGRSAAFFHTARIAALWGYQALSILKTRSILSQAFQNLDCHLLKHEDLQKGDVILSYKTARYLHKDLLSKLIAVAANSSITHALITTESGNEPKLLCSSALGNGLNLALPSPDPGEIYLVMRLHQVPKKQTEKLSLTLDRWNKNVRLLRIYKFSELKCWMASLLGFLYVFSVCILRRPIILRNIAKDRPGYFCSEIIDDIFKEAGLFLTPRSEHAALAGPVEFFHSPYLSFQGIIMNNNDHETLKEELAAEFHIG